MKFSTPVKMFIFALICICVTTASHAQDKRVRMFLGLSFPKGGGVSLQQWQEWERTVLAKQLEVFNIVETTGYYKGQPERSKVVTVIVFKGDKETMNKIKAIAQDYAKRFGQESVLVVTTEAEAIFVEKP
jgi:hypothetical protein